jgi:hypothetical protein
MRFSGVKFKFSKIPLNKFNHKFSSYFIVSEIVYFHSREISMEIVFDGDMRGFQKDLLNSGNYCGADEKLL